MNAPRMDRAVAAGACGWVVVVAGAVLWPRISPLPDGAGLHAAPFYGHWGIHDLIGLVPAVLVAVAIVRWWPSLVDRLSAVTLMVATGAASCAWAVVLAASNGLDRVHTPMLDRHGYASVARDITSPTEFIADFVGEVRRYPIHVKGHPPMMPVMLWALRAIGLEGSAWAAASVLAAWSLGIVAVMSAVINLGGVEAGRRASAAVAFIPGVVWAATTPDALFFGVAAVAMSLIVIGTGRSGWRGDLAATLGGMVAGLALHLTYGVLPLALVPLAVALTRRRVRPLVLAGLGLSAVFLVFRSIGFWWFDGLHATRGFYEIGISSKRPYWYFVLFGNPGALLVGVGPVAAAGLARVAQLTIARFRNDPSGGTICAPPRTRLSALVRSAGTNPLVLGVAAVAAVGLADISGLSKAEVERIWLIFMPWIAILGLAVWTRPTQRWWLASQLVLGLIMQAILVTPW